MRAMLIRVDCFDGSAASSCASCSGVAPDRVLIGVPRRKRGLLALQLAGPQAHEPRVIQLAHVLGRNAQSDHDLRESARERDSRLALAHALDIPRIELVNVKTQSEASAALFADRAVEVVHPAPMRRSK